MNQCGFWGTYSSASITQFLIMGENKLELLKPSRGIHREDDNIELLVCARACILSICKCLFMVIVFEWHAYCSHCYSFRIYIADTGLFLPSTTA